MTTREKIQAEVEKLSEERLEEFYRLVKEFMEMSPRKPGLLSNLQQIRIDAPEDFAANFDLSEETEAVKADGGERMAEALARISRTHSAIADLDPLAWEREIRQERDLPGRDSGC